MTHATRSVGSIDVTAIVDADLELEPIPAASPDIPPDALRGDDEDSASIRTAGGDWRLRVRAWLIRHPAGLVLVDTGIGGPNAPTAALGARACVVVQALGDLGI